MSGVRLPDQFLYRRLLAGPPRGLAHHFSAAGYRTVVVMPGIKKPVPGAEKFWGFDAAYYAAGLGYHGPRFGWFDVPDQYTLRTLAEREPGGARQPLFAEIVLVSSHTPFHPVPPYLDDWSDADRFATVPEATWRALEASPDWAHLEQPYLASVAYDLRTLAYWLAHLVPDGALVIILGDHQPPSVIGDAQQPWTVPIHVLSRDAELLRPFAALGYAEGPVPPRAAPARGMESFLGDFLAAFGPAPDGARDAMNPAANR